MTKKFEAITQLPKQALEKINIKKRLLQEDVAEDLRENLIEKDLVGIAPHWQEGQAGSTSQASMVLAQADGAAGAAADAAGGAAGAAGAGAGAAGMSTAAAASAANASFGGLAGMAGVSSGVTALAGGVAGLGVAVSVASAQKPVADTTAPTVSPVADTTAPAAPSVAEHGTSDLSDNVLNKAESVSTIFRVTLPTTGSQALAGDSLELLLDGRTFGTAKTVILTSTDISNGYVDFTVRRADLGADGAKALSAKITDVAGNVGPDSSALNFMLDTSGRYITVGSAAIWEDTDQDGVQDSDETQTYTLDANNQLQDANGLVDFSKEQVTIRFTDVTRGVLDVTGFDANDKIQIDRAAGLANFMGLKQFLSANTLSGVDPTGNPANYGAIFARPATRTAASGAYHTYFANSEYAIPNLGKMTRYIALSTGFISPTSTKLYAYGSERIGFDPTGFLGLRSLARKTTYMEFLRGLPATAHGQVEYLLPKTVIEQGSSDLSDDILNAAESATTNFRVTLPANGTQAMGDSLELLLDGNAFGTAKTVILTSTDISNGYVDFTVLRADLGADGAKALRATITDASGQSGADSTTLKFTLDTHAPTLLTTSPLDDATSVAPASDIVLTFSETVIAGAGNIVISNGTDTRTIDVTDTSQVTIIGDTVTINPTTDLNASSSYHVHVDAGALINIAGNGYVGISNDTDLNFATGIGSSKLYYTVGMINGAAAVWKEDVDTSTGSFLSGTEGVFDGNDTRLQANDFSGNGFKQITAANASVNDVTVRFNIANGELLDLSGFDAGDKVIIDMKTHMSSFMGIPGFATATNVRNTIRLLYTSLNQGVQAKIWGLTQAGGPRTLITAKVTFNVGAYTGPLPGQIAYSGVNGRPNNDYGIVAVGFSPLSTLQYILP